MSNKKSHRRDGPRNKKRTENGPRWENPNPGAGCNSTHVAGARKGWSDLRRRAERRTGRTPKNYRSKQGKPLSLEDPRDEE